MIPPHMQTYIIYIDGMQFYNSIYENTNSWAWEEDIEAGCVQRKGMHIYIYIQGCLPLDKTGTYIIDVILCGGEVVDHVFGIGTWAGLEEGR